MQFSRNFSNGEAFIKGKINTFVFNKMVLRKKPFLKGTFEIFANQASKFV
jgi:hypothetical protein